MNTFIELISGPESRQLIGLLGLSALVWSIAAGSMLILVRYAGKQPALLKYHLCSAALFALPLGLLATPVLDIGSFWPSGSAFESTFTAFIGSDAITLSEITVLSAGEADDSTSFWHAVPVFGVLTIVLLLMPLAGLIRLAWVYAGMRGEVSATIPLNMEEPNSNRVYKQAERLRQDFNISRKVAIRWSAKAAGPFTLGWRKPLIVLPEAFRNAEKERLTAVLTHELVHIARADYTLHFTELLIRHLFWLHPLVHLLYREAACQRELACDAEVLRQPEIEPAQYARLLYEFSVKPAHKPAFRAAMSQEAGLLRRIRQIQKSSFHPSSTNPNKTSGIITMKKSIFTSIAFFLFLSALMACSDLTQNPDADSAADVEIHGQVYTPGELRELLTDMRADFSESLQEAPEARAESFHSAMREQIDTVDQLIMLLDNNEPERVAAGLEQLMETAAPPPPQKDDNELFMVVEEMPRMKGGQMELYKNLIYPEEARDQGMEGRVIAQFEVHEDGSVHNINVVRSAGQILDDAAVKAISLMEFEPGMQQGQAVRVLMTQPIVFRLQ